MVNTGVWGSALLVIGVGLWIALTPPLGRPWAVQILQWYLKLIMGMPRTEEAHRRRERLVAIFVAYYVWGSRILGAFFVLMGVGALFEVLR